MNPTDYDKIVDKLLVFRGKIPVDGTLLDSVAAYYCQELRQDIDFLIQRIDWFAESDAKGLIK